MAGDSLSHLCRLVDVSLRPHKAVLDLVEFSKEKERNLLISLSQIFRRIHDRNGECCTSVCENHHCLTNVVANLISFLTVESKYVKHSVGNILVAVSKFIAGDECIMRAHWQSFVDLLVNCLEVSISNVLLHSLVNKFEHLKYDPPAPVVIQLGLKNSSWSTVAEILRIVRAVIKDSKEDNEHDGESLEIIISSLSLCFAEFPWDTLDAVHKSGNFIDQSRFCESRLLGATVAESRIVFLGGLVQLFCSLVETVNEIDGPATLQNRHLLIQRIKNLVPQISEWCLAKEWIQYDMHILPYFQHKNLMLMSRLGSRVWTDCSTVMLWLQLLHKFYKDFLTKPMSLIDYAQDSCLEGSPFLWSLSNQHKVNLSSCHLQRQSIFLLLRLSMCLIVREESNGLICTCGPPDSESTSGSRTVEKCSARRLCIVEFCEWLQSHFPYSTIAGNEIDFKTCINFSSSFIKLYIHEDDLLFEVLLQMFNVATYADKHKTFKSECASQEAGEDALFHISELFNPILLFHVFLAELQYDHQLLLDYLISKDSGTRCAEYLLKCLRKVCDSWKAFVQLPLELENDGKQMLKKRKISLESQEERTSTSQNGLAMLEKEYSEDKNDPQSKRSGAKSVSFVKARTCLLSLKSALEKLHKRNLFPYNPEVLLRRDLKNFVVNEVGLYFPQHAKLQYDHQLLDYLISKDSGTRQAGYLLKCLCEVCESWQTFVQLPLELENDGKQMLKKRKFS